jgi:hypothetical protein
MEKIFHEPRYKMDVNGKVRASAVLSPGKRIRVKVRLPLCLTN